MASQLQVISASAVLLLLPFISHLIMRRLLPSSPQPITKKRNPAPEPTPLIKTLASALSDCIILPQDVAAFEKSINSYWAQQECEVVPACVIRPRDTQQLSTAVKILNREYRDREKSGARKIGGGLFAIRSGGHSPIPNAASIKGGVVIDLSLFCEVTPSEDELSVVIGTGAKWGDVSRILDERGLAVVGGRNSAVGVGGLTLGGGLSFFSPRYGLVWSNIISYEIILASGTITTASASNNPDLWRALKGGSNNFGIVTRFTARSFPSTKIWSGFLYLPTFQLTKVLAAFHESVNRAHPNSPSSTHDNYATGPLACFSYIQALRMEVISINLVYTKPPSNSNQWPTYWKTSPFAKLWRIWSTCELRTLTSAIEEMHILNPPGRRQVFATTTIKNDPKTIVGAHTAYRDAIVLLRVRKVKGLVWTLVLQALPPHWVRKGDDNPQGLDDVREPLVIVSFTVNWDESKDDEFVKSTTRRVVEQIEAVATVNKTGHRYRFLNYCAEWQRPFEGYGEENWRFLKEVSRKYDPEGLFQRGCVGGFKLDV